MALLRAESRWERVVVPAFVYFFAQLYPFRQVNRPSARTAAAAGGCMLVRRDALAAAGGLDPIRGARIDDVALGRLLKRPPSAARIWLGFTHRGAQPAALSPAGRPVGHDRAQRLHAAAVLAGPARADPGRPAVAVRAAAGGRRGRAGRRGGRAAAPRRPGRAWPGWPAGPRWPPVSCPSCGCTGLGWWRAPLLPLVAVLYAVMTADSARRHYAGRGGEWKGRTVPHRGGQSVINRP